MRMYEARAFLLHQSARRIHAVSIEINYMYNSDSSSKGKFSRAPRTPRAGSSHAPSGERSASRAPYSGASGPSRSSFAPSARPYQGGGRSSGGSGARPYQGGSSRPYQGGGSRPPYRGGGGSRFGGGGGRYGGGGGGRGGGGRSFDKYIDASRFVNKAVITEKVEHFVPEHAFADFKVDERLKTAISKKGYVLPTPIQDKAIPHILRGEDVVGIANTGTGKTAAFLIPLIDKMLKNPEEEILIMVPTRELALQIEQEFRGFAPGLRLYSACFVGGVYIGKDLQKLRQRNNLVIGTPGRLKDLVERRALNLSKFKTVVLDEADRMLDMGFIADMRFMLSKMESVRHTLFFSATLTKEIEKLIKDFLTNPVTISVKTQETAESIDQDVVNVSSNETKIDVLLDLLKQPEFDKVLVFGKTKHGVEKLAKALVAMGVRAESIHGNKTHGKRQKALDLFKRDQVQVLVATDVAARGLDIVGVSHVINFDIPSTYEDYVHRIGRTGRGGKKGKALTFVEQRAGRR